jgi:hypothetical protein
MINLYIIYFLFFIYNIQLLYLIIINKKIKIFIKTYESFIYI